MFLLLFSGSMAYTPRLARIQGLMADLQDNSFEQIQGQQLRGVPDGKYCLLMDCPAVDNCADGSVTCDPAPTRMDTIISECSNCNDGFFVDGGKCTECTVVENCADTSATCASAEPNCQQCNSGFYVLSRSSTFSTHFFPSEEASGSCEACDVVDNCADTFTTCTSAEPNCQQCNSGFYVKEKCNIAGSCEKKGSCEACDAIENCAEVTCKAAEVTAAVAAAAKAAAAYDSNLMFNMAEVAMSSTCQQCNTGYSGEECDTCTYEIDMSRSDHGSNKKWKTTTVKASPGETFQFNGCSVKHSSGKWCKKKYGIKQGIRLLKDSKGNVVSTGVCCNSIKNKVLAVRNSCEAPGARGVDDWFEQDNEFWPEENYENDFYKAGRGLDEFDEFGAGDIGYDPLEDFDFTL